MAESAALYGKAKILSGYSKRPRLKGFTYLGCHRYFITICTHQKRPVFSNAEIVALCLDILKKKSSALDFKVWAYCFMPDHLHLLLEGETQDADLKRLILLFKQASGYSYRKIVDPAFSADEKPKLWQTSFYDHVLRKDEELLDVVRYILNNLVRKGLVRNYTEYMHSGSLVFRGGIKGVLLRQG